MDVPKRGEIWLVCLDPTVGSEIGKRRPAIVISNDRNNQLAETVTVILITSKTDKIYPFEVLLPSHETHQPHDSKAKTNQVRTLDKKRLIKPLAMLPAELIVSVEQALLIHLGIAR